MAASTTIRNGKAFFYHKDHLGSVVAITNDAGEVTQKNQYSSFGKILSIKNNDRQEIGIEEAIEKSFAYTGREWDEEIALYYYRARHYDPIEGRFMQKDPIGLDAGDPNVYRYVQNNTINFADPLGLLSFENNLARRRLSNSGNSIAKSLTALALGGVFAKRYGTVTILEALRYRLSIATLGGSVGLRWDQLLQQQH